ncbi:LLM class flavin-dependent oxidoreductase [Planotetraspora sp. A-T 1434]|uniref:LLM class flavin-dependent oxidoreductase n=1 Tax=Planotetraspora sp. A-T 1434 TaxID=2979219 RepID=UPI0021C250CB|nr:LLM class flavin-dependent oxidoreductase [Planotetraspora sp. A-T 1434]MCT9933430.1 LLM class flavin-dependent oxidoreductase [Planotetraspora sp. A-T 1434]
MATTPEEHPIVIGVDSFGDMTLDSDGTMFSQPQNIRALVAEGVLSEESGIDFFGLGEHHIEEMPLPAPDLVLASIAARTSRIHLGSAVTVLSSDDPVRVFQRYATLDALSSGRAEVILGRGSSIESFPLFGFDLADYERLFEEKLELFAQLRTEQPVTWAGTTRAALPGLQVYPRTAGGALPTWVGVGGNPASVVRAAKYGFPLMLAIIGGNPARFARLSKLYREATAQAGLAPLPIGVHSPGHVAATDEEAKEQYWPTYESFMLDARRQRGFPAITREYYEHEVAHGSLYVGSPETVARRIARTMTALDATRFDLKYGMGPMPHELIMENLRLFGTEVAPRVREQLQQG